MNVIEKAQQRMMEEDRAGNDDAVIYWAAYLDGARAQRNELTKSPSWDGSKTIDLPKMEVQDGV